MVRLIFVLSCLLLAVYSTKGEEENPSTGGILESDNVEELMKNESITEDTGALEDVNNIIQMSTLFARKLSSSYVCHGSSAIEQVTPDEDQHEENNEYIIFYNSDKPEKIFKIIADPSGDKMIITVEREHRISKAISKYSLLIDNADYAEDERLDGDSTSRKIVSLEEKTVEEICAVEPTPSARICFAMINMFSMNREQLANFAETNSGFIENHIKICK